MTIRGEQESAGGSAGMVTPAEREERWEVTVRLAIEAASASAARVLAGQAVARLEPELALRAGPAITALGLREGIWVATLRPDLTVLSSIDPDDADNRCRYVSSHFPAGASWMSRKTPGLARWDWPPDIWSRRPGHDDVLLHPAVQAVMIWCEAR
jgi:hypothetical protein